MRGRKEEKGVGRNRRRVRKWKKNDERVKERDGEEMKKREMERRMKRAMNNLGLKYMKVEVDVKCI